jgi:hypothetical protein
MGDQSTQKLGQQFQFSEIQMCSGGKVTYDTFSNSAFILSQKVMISASLNGRKIVPGLPADFAGLWRDGSCPTLVPDVGEPLIT